MIANAEKKLVVVKAKFFTECVFESCPTNLAGDVTRHMRAAHLPESMIRRMYVDAQLIHS
jgi:hypothetical protein